mgnify:CR=1 FL=1
MYNVKLVDGSASQVDGNYINVEDSFIRIYDRKFDPETTKLSQETELVFYAPVDSIICIQKA